MKQRKISQGYSRAQVDYHDHVEMKDTSSYDSTRVFPTVRNPESGQEESSRGIQDDTELSSLLLSENKP